MHHRQCLSLFPRQIPKLKFSAKHHFCVYISINYNIHFVLDSSSVKNATQCAHVDASFWQMSAKLLTLSFHYPPRTRRRFYTPLVIIIICRLLFVSRQSLLWLPISRFQWLLYIRTYIRCTRNTKPTRKLKNKKTHTRSLWKFVE